MTRPRIGPAFAPLLLLLAAAIGAGEPLLCRGFDGASAANAVASYSGRLLVLDPALRERRVWFALAGSDPLSARQALAHALGCWWTSAPVGQLTRQSQLAAANASVQTFPPLPSTPPGSEALIRRLMEPWLGGDGGLALDPVTRTWTATASPAGLSRLEQLLSALADPAPRAPDLIAGRRLDDLALARSPRGAGLGPWCLDLSACSGLAVSLGPDCDPAAAAPEAAVNTVGEAATALAARGLSLAMHHGCLAIGAEPPGDRRHPAERAAIALLPVGHLCRDGDQATLLASQLGARVTPRNWDLPGWGIAPLPWRGALLVVADPPTIHAVMTALEAADQIGLDAWLR